MQEGRSHAQLSDLQQPVIVIVWPNHECMSWPGLVALDMLGKSQGRRQRLQEVKKQPMNPLKLHLLA